MLISVIRAYKSLNKSVICALCRHNNSLKQPENIVVL